jgi:hypothetical protein
VKHLRFWKRLLARVCGRLHSGIRLSDGLSSARSIVVDDLDVIDLGSKKRCLRGCLTGHVTTEGPDDVVSR